MTAATDTETLTTTEISSGFNHAETIQTVIAGMDADQSALENQTGDTWKFRYGTVEVMVSITGEDPSDTFTVLSPVLSYPVKDELKLLRLLMQKNASDTFEARFAVQNDQVIVICSRSVDSLDSSEISRIITIVAAIADENDELLQAEFAA